MLTRRGMQVQNATLQVPGDAIARMPQGQLRNTRLTRPQCQIRRPNEEANLARCGVQNVVRGQSSLRDNEVDFLFAALFVM